MKRDEGFTLAEVLVGIAIAMTVLSIITATFISMMRTERFTSSESESLADVRLSLDRLEREARQASLIYEGGPKKVMFWVDYNGDGESAASERITWEVVAADDKAKLIRTTEVPTDTGHTFADDIVDENAFTYNALDATLATTLGITLSADAHPNQLGSKRTVTTEVRMRNAATP